MAIVTISRGSFSLGQDIAERVARHLDCPCVGREVAREAAEKLGVPVDLVSQKIEQAPSLWERFKTDRGLYVTAMQAVLAERAAGGCLVYHGYAGHLLLKGLPSLLKVRVIAPLEVRVPLVMQRQGIGPGEAEAYIRKVDQNRAKWTKFIYDVNWEDPYLYDVVVNLATLSAQAACESILAAARLPEFAWTPELGAELQDFALLCRARLALIRDPVVSKLNLEVQGRRGTVTVRGRVPQPSLPIDARVQYDQQIRTVLGQVEGIGEIVTDLEVFPLTSGD
jgi:cytidylate kinase